MTIIHESIQEITFSVIGGAHCNHDQRCVLSGLVGSTGNVGGSYLLRWH